MTPEPDGTVLDLRSVFGVEATITTPSSATDGEYVEMDCTLEPGNGTTIHYHPEQVETYEVVEGTMDVFYDERWRTVRTDESFTVPQGEVHGFRNTSGATVQFLNVHRPALGFQTHLETLDRLIRAGKVSGMRDPRSLIYLSMSAMEHQPDVAVKPPQWMVKALAFVGGRLGFELPAAPHGLRGSPPNGSH